MFNVVDTRLPRAVEQEVSSLYARLFPDGDREFVRRAFSWLEQSFSGGCANYQAIDARYHDIEHTLQGTLCLARLIEGRHRAGAKPSLGQKQFELVLAAMLFHDTGYLKKKGDTEGTGAKYTAIHVLRSVEFAREFLARQNYPDPEIIAVQNMIRCTGVYADLTVIPFQNEIERVLGFALATADLLGQMAAPDYIDKLPILYEEFEEAVQFDSYTAAQFAIYGSAQELIRRTPEFWRSYVFPRMTSEFGKLYAFLNDPYPDGPNIYLEGVEKNLARLKQKLSTAGDLPQTAPKPSAEIPPTS